MLKRPEIEKFRTQYWALVLKYDLPAFEALLAEHKPQLSAEEKREFVEDFKRASERALLHRWLSSK
jgi:hypothetical protein